MASKKAAKQPVAPKQDWKATFIAKYPQFKNILDGGPGESEARNVFGDDIIDLILDVANNPSQYDFTTQAGLDAFDSKVYATKYYNETSNAAKAFDALTDGERTDKVQTNRVKIASEYGDLGLTKAELDDIAATVSRRGLAGIAASQYINTVVGSRGRGKEDLLESADAAGLKKVADAYGYKPSDLDDQILAAIQGKEYDGEILTADSFKRKGVALAKAAHFQLAPQLDAGLTLAEIFSPYRDLASRVLEMAPESIDFNDPKFSLAFGTRDKPAMSLSEWMETMKTDPKYGYDKTSQAKSDARAMVMSMAKAFGKVE
jgi:hypothetical protein